MALYLITGVAGTGKTTICYELRARGFTAYDGDKDHLAHWYDKDWNITHYDGTAEFIRLHHRSIAAEVMDRLNREAINKPVFLCNDPDNENELQQAFAHIFALVLDTETIKKRLSTRLSTTKNYEWGKLPHELDLVLKQEHLVKARLKSSRYTAIDAAQTTAHIVDQILHNLQPA